MLFSPETKCDLEESHQSKWILWRCYCLAGAHVIPTMRTTAQQWMKPFKNWEEVVA